MADNRGNFDVVDQTRLDQLSGGSDAVQVITTDGSTKTPGHLVALDTHGNLVDAGISIASVSASLASAGTTHTEILTDSNGPITSNGDFIYVSGVPN
jgi:small nuclear ribonucleoprotein (snRNP)-like protein